MGLFWSQQITLGIDPPRACETFWAQRAGFLPARSRNAPKGTVMARKTLPYYPFYVDAFDEGVLSMNLAEVGLYILALGHSWKHGSIPDDPAELARLIRRKPSEVRKVWP